MPESKYSAENESMQSTDDLIYQKRKLKNHIEGLQRTILVIEDRVSSRCATQEHYQNYSYVISVSSYHKARSDPQITPLDEAEAAASRLLSDFNCLLRKAQALSIQYKETMDDIRNKAQLCEQKGIEKNEKE